MRLTELLSAQPEKRFFRTGGDPDIGAIRYDSRTVKPGDLFVAVKGFHTDGHRFVGQALARGAAAVVVEEGAGLPELGTQAREAGSVPVIAVPDSRRALGRLAAKLHEYPSRKLRVIGVTGTDGKTTTTFLISAVLEGLGYRTGLLWTVNFKIADRWLDNSTRQTTPEAPEIQAMLAAMVEARVDYAILESTSHALALDRVTDCDYDVAVFTNLTSDHLDFHGTREQYLQDKARLFRLLSSSAEKGIPKTSVLNADDPASAILRTCSPARVISYGLTDAADVRAQDLRLGREGTAGRVCTGVESASLWLPMPGLYNVYNALAAVAVGLSQGLALRRVCDALSGAGGVPGRMEPVAAGQPFSVIVDYAHTADSLRKALGVVRPLTEGRLLLVFGCAGERDKGKRPEMGRAAGELADFFVLTNEDPRLEDAEAILADIEMGAVAAGRERGRDYLKIPDRREAIHAACARARPGDLVLLAGKGHEGCIIVGTEKVPWDERQAAREVLAALGYRRLS